MTTSILLHQQNNSLSLKKITVVAVTNMKLSPQQFLLAEAILTKLVETTISFSARVPLIFTECRPYNNFNNHINRKFSPNPSFDSAVDASWLADESECLISQHLFLTFIKYLSVLFARPWQSRVLILYWGDLNARQEDPMYFKWEYFK